MRKYILLPTGCLIVVVISFGILFGVTSLFVLRMLNVYTEEKAIAEVEMSGIQTDSDGAQYIEIQYTPYLDSSTAGVLKLGQPETYQIYGDTVAVRGPFVKLHDGLLFLNYKNLYKLSLIEGEYRRNNNPTSREGTEIFINGGYSDSWWSINDQEASFPFNLLIDRVTFSGDEEPGFYGTQKKRYEIVVTFDTLTWNLKAVIE